MLMLELQFGIISVEEVHSCPVSVVLVGGGAVLSGVGVLWDLYLHHKSLSHQSTATV